MHQYYKMWSVLISLILATLGTNVLQIQASLSDSRRVRFGETAAENKFPYFALLEIQIKEFLEIYKFQILTLFCGSTIIGKQWLLTAAHCLERSNANITAYVGSNEYMKGIKYSIKSKIVHPDYLHHRAHDVSHVYNDLAILMTVDVMIFSDKVKPIKLMETEVAPNENVWIVGFGTDQDPSKPDADLSAHTKELKSGTRFVITKEQCWEQLHKYIDIHDNQTCTYAIERNSGRACYGDSGGPVIYKADSEEDRRLAGIISQSHECLALPEIFVTISVYINFIKNITGEL